jgi:hypothetical protein
MPRDPLHVGPRQPFKRNDAINTIEEFRPKELLRCPDRQMADSFRSPAENQTGFASLSSEIGVQQNQRV